MAKMRQGTDKGITALAFNQMEQRCLEKSMQTLSLEQGYQLKLLNLDHRVLKVNYKHLKEKVAKIRSHLSPEQITDLKKMEADGKLKSNSFNLNSALKIAAAAKRLKLNGHKPGKQRRSRTAQSFTPNNHTLTESSVLFSRPTTSNNNHMQMCRRTKRSNSVSGAFIDATDDLSPWRPGSTSNISTIRPVSASVRMATVDDKSSQSEIVRPSTCAGSARKKSEHLTVTRPNHTNQTSGRSPYSSHSLIDKNTNKTTDTKDRRWSFMTDDSIDSHLGDNLYEERRRELLSSELIRSKILEKRKEAFIKGVNEYLKENPPDEFFFDPSEIIEIFQEENAAERVDGVIPRLRSKWTQRVGAWNSMSVEDKEEQYTLLWKDLNKCRYIRAPDASLDFTGVVTLARDQMRMLNSLGGSKGESFLSSVRV